MSDWNEAINDLEDVRKAVFGDVGDEPNVYADYDRLCELASKMASAMTFFDNAKESEPAAFLVSTPDWERVFITRDAADRLARGEWGGKSYRSSEAAMTREHLSEQALIDLSRAQRETELRLFPAYLRDLPDETVQRFEDHCLIAGALDVAAECSERLTQIEAAA